MKTVLLLGGPAAGQRVEVHGVMTSWLAIHAEGPGEVKYKVVPMCSHGEVHWFGVLDGADPLALLIAGYAAPIREDGIDFSLKRGDTVYSAGWGAGAAALEVVDVNWALRAASLKLSPTGSTVVWPVAGLQRQPIEAAA